MYGHIHGMAQAVAEGASGVARVEVILRREPETFSAEVLEKMGAAKPQKAMASVPICTVDELKAADAIIFGTPTVSATCAGRCAISGRYGPTLVKGSTDEKGRQRFHPFRHPKWRARIDHTHLPHHLSTPGDGGGRTPLCLRWTDGDF